MQSGFALPSSRSGLQRSLDRRSRPGLYCWRSATLRISAGYRCA